MTARTAPKAPPQGGTSERAARVERAGEPADDATTTPRADDGPTETAAANRADDGPSETMQTGAGQAGAAGSARGGPAGSAGGSPAEMAGGNPVETAGDGPTEAAITPRERRSADARALTQVLFAELSGLEPGSTEHARVRTALIEANLPLVRYAAARFRSRNEPIEDVIQVGTIGLINAIDRFDPHRGVQFPTFAMPTVVGEIKRYFRDNVRTVHVPRRLHELWVQVSGATEDLTVLHGRTPTTAEIAERLGIGEDEVLACIEAGRSYHATSLEAAQEGDGLPGLLDRLGYEDPALAGVEHRDLVRHLLVQLPEREQRILLLRYYSNLTQSQISAELGVSQMHVSRLLSRSFARLRSANRIES
ncbi:RNA polymerase sigma-B factor [Streptomyces zagrosensis]|uniref:RNA polymerase sigma-B factor n=2 Tax=Streptomyces zagrosensis TaxID=1042984 RepID=A0A7W9UXG7_9ACTN|nr:RNA polymerase sigma-B factor [Streptomyces zagrosensis]